MHSSLDLLGDLYDLLLLKGLGDLDKVSCLPSLACKIHVTDIVQSHDLIPLEILAEHLECLRLLCKRSKLFRLMSVRYSKEKTVTIHCQSPYLEISCAWQQSFIIIVRCVTESIIVHIYVSGCLEKADLILVAHLFKELDSILSAYFMSSERHVLISDVAHACVDRINILLSQSSTVMLVDRAEISFGDRTSQNYLALREQIFSRLAEKEAQRAAINAAAGIRCIIDELYLSAVKSPVFQALTDVVDLCCDDRIWSLEFGCECRNHVHEGCALRKGPACLSVYAKDIYHDFYEVSIQRI